MITAGHLKTSAHIGISSRLGVFDPCAVHAKRHLVLGLARGGTGVTADAFALVNQKSVIGHEYLLKDEEF
jgi:hypothetical protein